jgi:hypothetical protein
MAIWGQSFGSRSKGVGTVIRSTATNAAHLGMQFRKRKENVAMQHQSGGETICFRDFSRSGETFDTTHRYCARPCSVLTLP